ncbi:MAG: hypothetical protein AABX07_00260 [Nanoarchaeota archaeon]
MKIGLDFDEVIVEFIEQILRFYHLKTGKKIEKKNFHSYDFWEVGIGATREEAIQIVDEFHDSALFDEIMPIEKAVQSVNYLLDKNEVFIITSRPISFKEKTERWIKKHLGKSPIVVYSGDFHTGQGKTKLSICKELGIKLIVEDAGKYALECANGGLKVILFDKPWNQGVENKNIIRVNNWLEALKEIDTITLKTIKN